MARRWTAVDRETGELLEFPSRAAMRQALRGNPTLKGRESEDVYQYRQSHPQEASKQQPPLAIGPLWSKALWSANVEDTYRQTYFDNATAGLRYAFLEAVTNRDAAAAAKIRLAWEEWVKPYGEGSMNGKTYREGMKGVSDWLYDTVYAPPVHIYYHPRNSDDYTPPDDEQPDFVDDFDDDDTEDGDEYE